MEVKVLYEDGEEEKAKEVLSVLENLHRKRFFFSWTAYKQTKEMLVGNTNSD